MLAPAELAGVAQRGERGSVRRGGVRRSGAVLEAPAFVAGLDDVAVMREAIEQRRMAGLVRVGNSEPRSRKLQSTGRASFASGWPMSFCPLSRRYFGRIANLQIAPLAT